MTTKLWAVTVTTTIVIAAETGDEARKEGSTMLDETYGKWQITRVARIGSKTQLPEGWTLSALPFCEDSDMRNTCGEIMNRRGI